MESSEPTPPVRRPSLVQRLIMGRSLTRTLLRATILALVCFVVFRFLLLPIRINGISMEPTYREGAINLVNALGYLGGRPARGDVVAIKLAGPSVMFLKRIIALPREEVEIREGVVLVNGQPLPEPYLASTNDWEFPPVKLEADEYFVIGDNRSMLQEEHTFGRVHRDRIAGKVLW